MIVTRLGTQGTVKLIIQTRHLLPMLGFSPIGGKVGSLRPKVSGERITVTNCPVV